MRTPLFLAALLAPAVARAQSAPLHPSPSRLFTIPADHDTTHAPPHRSMVQSGAVGAGVGALAGIGIGLLAQGPNPGGEDPGAGVIVLGGLGAIVGFVVGMSLADHPR